MCRLYLPVGHKGNIVAFQSAVEKPGIKKKIALAIPMPRFSKIRRTEREAAVCVMCKNTRMVMRTLRLHFVDVNF